MHIKKVSEVIPFYLQSKLSVFGIVTVDDLLAYDYVLVFQWLKDLYPSIGYKVLYDLYSLQQQLPLNSLDQETQTELQKNYKRSLPHYAPLSSTKINHYLNLAEELALKLTTEIPIAAIIVKDNQVIASGTNETCVSLDITSHAEIVAITNAANKLGSHRLDGCDLYVTIEPCLMCVGAILHSRIKRVIFGAVEPKTGAIISQYRGLDNSVVNKHTEAIGPVDNTKYAKSLQLFLQSKR